MNHYTQLLTFIKSLGEEDPFVNTITRDGEIDLDINKMNVFPLLDIYIPSGSFSNGRTLNFDVELYCVDIRDINKDIVNDKFWKNDNEVDNHNETLATLNRIWTAMYRNFERNDITASENPTLEKVTYSNKNLLDGWKLSFEVEMPNTTLNLCDE
jgi:hypothetical protein